MESRIREAAVAGLFYPAEGRPCRRLVQQLLAGSREPAAPIGTASAAIAPHAGHIYSGALAARVYPWLLDAGGGNGLLAILAPNHRVPLAGMALDGHAAFGTPLGAVDVASDVGAELAALPGVSVDNAAHSREHAIEVHLPFLQVLGFSGRIVPIVVGQCPATAVADVIACLVERHQARILVSSDLSHFLPYVEAQQADAATSRAIEQLRSDLQPEQACGCSAVNGLNVYARRSGWQVQTLGTCNSGDASCDRARVVGYGAYAYAAP